MDTRINRPISDAERKLGLAAELGGIDAIRRLVVDEHVDINTMVTSSGKTALQIAIETNNLEAFRFLLQLGANPTQPCLDGLEVTPLHLAAANGDERYLMECLQRGVDPNVMMSNGMTPLFFAAKHGRGTNTNRLIKLKASLFRRSANGDSPLSLAIASGHQGTIDTIVNAMKAKHKADTLLNLFKLNDYLRHSFEKTTSVDAVNSLFTLIGALLAANIPTAEIQALLPDRATSSAALNSLIQMQLDRRLVRATTPGDISIVKTLLACGANPFTFQDVSHTVFRHCLHYNHDVLDIILSSECANTNKFQQQLWSDFTGYITRETSTQTVEKIASKILSPEFNLAAIAADETKLSSFRSMLTSVGSNAKIFLCIYKVYKKIEALNIGREKLQMMLPVNNDDYKLLAKDIKENLLQEIKLMPPQQQLEMCLAAENPDDLLGHVMQMQRGVQKCRPGHGILKEIAEVKARALAQGAKIPEAQTLKLNTVALDTGHDALVEKIKSVVANLKPLVLPDINTILATLAKQEFAMLAPQTSVLKTSELNTRLLEAARFDNAAAIKSLIAQGAEVNMLHEPHGQTALDCAAAYGSINAMRALIAAGADVNLGRREDKTQTPLHFAAQFGQTKVAKVLLEHNADTNILNQRGQTPLLLAIEDNNKELVDLLLKHGASPYQASYAWKATLMQASLASADILEVVVNHIISKEISGDDIEALQQNNLLLQCFNANKEPGRKRDLLFKIIEKLLLQRVNLDVIRKLIPAMGLPEKYQHLKPAIALQQAILNDDVPTIILLACRQDAGQIINPADKRSSPLRHAIEQSRLTAARLLLAICEPALIMEGINNFQIGDGYHYSRNMLMHACQYSSKEMVEMLLDNGADPYFVNHSVSALAVAAAGKRDAIVKLLVDRLLAIGDPKKIIEILRKENNFRFAISRAANKEIFAELYRVVDYLIEQKVDHSVIKELLPDTNSLWKKAGKHKVDYIHPEFKTFNLEHMKSLPLAKRIEAYNEALDPNTPRGHIAYMARGGIRCKLGHGMLKDIAELRDAAVAEMKQLATPDALHDAASKGDLNKVAELIKYGANVNADSSKALQKSLIIAAYEGREAVVELLLRNGADVNAVITKGEDIHIGVGALFAATEENHIGIVKMLLDRGANVNAVTHKFRLTPLHRAAIFGRAEIIPLLLAKGADIHAKNSSQSTALVSSIKNGNDSATTLLIDYLIAHEAPHDLLTHMQDNNQLKKCFRKAKNEDVKATLMRIAQHLVDNGIGLDVVNAMLPADKQFPKKIDAVSEPAVATQKIYPDLKNLEALPQPSATENNNAAEQMIGTSAAVVSDPVAAERSVFELLYEYTDAPANLTPPMKPGIAPPVAAKSEINANDEPFFSLKSLTASPKISRSTALDAQMAELEQVFASAPVESTSVTEEQLAKLDSLFAASSPVLFRAPDPQQQTKLKKDAPAKTTKQAVLL